MSCERNSVKAGRQVGRKSGITSTASKSGFVAGVASRVAGLPSQLKGRLTNESRKTSRKSSRTTDTKPAKKQKAGKAKKKASGKSNETPSTKAAKKRKMDQAKRRTNGKSSGQVSVFAPDPPNKTLKPLSPIQESRNSMVSVGKQATGRQGDLGDKEKRPLPTQRQIKLAGVFLDKELQSLSVQFRLDAAAARRHMRELSSGKSRGIGHSDPRPADWVKSDMKNYDFLVGQISQVRQGLDHLDVSSLNQNDLVDLWDFSGHEADQSLRFIDHLQGGGSHLKGETASYLTDKYSLKGRFCSYLSEQLEPMISPKMLADYERA